MENKKININGHVRNVFTNNIETNEMIIFFHGLDGAPNLSKPLFDAFGEMLVVAPEQRGHGNNEIKDSRMIYKHLNDYMEIINYYKALGKKIYIVAEAMGASYSVLLAYKYKDLVEDIFCWSIPIKLINLMSGPKSLKRKIQIMTFISYLTNIKYSWTTSTNYEEFSSSEVFQRLAKVVDETKKRDIRETLSAWAASKRAWKKIKRGDSKTKLFYFNGTQDVLSDLDKVKKAFNRRDPNKTSLTLIEGGKHILMHEPQFEQIVCIIKKEINKEK